MIACTGTTRRGAPCRRPAFPNSQPPRCHLHRLPGDDNVPSPQTAAAARDLSAELLLVRDVLSRLADRLDDPTYTLLPDDLRTLATLIYSGVRTVAYLLARQPEVSSDLETWLNRSLDELAADLPIDL